MMELLYVLCVAMVVITIVSVILLVLEKKKQQNNPIPKLRNHDKRFSEITSAYVQKMFRANRGK